MQTENHFNNVVECLNVGIGYPVRCVFAISISGTNQFEQNESIKVWRPMNSNRIEQNCFVFGLLVQMDAICFKSHATEIEMKRHEIPETLL